jgi:hypothetical protein
VRRIASLPLYQVCAVMSVAGAALGLTPCLSMAQAPADTLPRYRDVTVKSDSAALVEAANDALQGLSSIEVPMRTTRYRHEERAVVVSLQPVPTPGVVWRNLAGTVRILEDGRRVLLSRE